MDCELSFSLRYSGQPASLNVAACILVQTYLLGTNETSRWGVVPCTTRLTAITEYEGWIFKTVNTVVLEVVVIVVVVIVVVVIAFIVVVVVIFVMI